MVTLRTGCRATGQLAEAPPADWIETFTVRGDSTASRRTSIVFSTAVATICCDEISAPSMRTTGLAFALASVRGRGRRIDCHDLPFLSIKPRIARGDGAGGFFSCWAAMDANAGEP